MSADSRAHKDTPMHPKENMCLQIALGAGVPNQLDCSSIVAPVGPGGLVRIFNSSTGLVSYKFSTEAVVSIDPAATSGPTACSRLGPNISVTAFVPVGATYLHLLSVNAGNVYVSQASELR